MGACGGQEPEGRALGIPTSGGWGGLRTFFPVSSGFSSDTVLFLIRRVELKWEFSKCRAHAGCWKSPENLGRSYTWCLLRVVGMEATVRVHHAGRSPRMQLTDPRWRQRSKKGCEGPQTKGERAP